MTGLFNVLMLELSSFFLHSIIQNGDKVISVLKNYCISTARCHTIKHLPWGDQNVGCCVLFCHLQVPAFCSCSFLEVFLFFLSLSSLLFKIALHHELQGGR